MRGRPTVPHPRRRGLLRPFEADPCQGEGGAPDLVLEALSSSTSRAEGSEAKDQKEKLELYERSGVRECWIVEPAGTWLCVYPRGSDGRFDTGELRDPDRDHGPVSSALLEGFTVDPTRRFED